MEPNLEKKVDCEHTEAEIMEKKWSDMKEISFRQGMIIAAMEDRFKQEHKLQLEDIKDEESCNQYLSESLIPYLIQGYTLGRSYMVEIDLMDLELPEKKPKKEYVPEGLYL